MSFPKNKRRIIVVNDITYEWCFSDGIIYYKNILPGSKVKQVSSIQFGTPITPKDIKEYILGNIGLKISSTMKADSKKKFDAASTEDRSKYKLYIWTNVLADYTSGIMFAYARSLKEARKCVKESFPEMNSFAANELNTKPTYIYSGESVGYHIYGSG